MPAMSDAYCPARYVKCLSFPLRTLLRWCAVTVNPASIHYKHLDGKRNSWEARRRSADQVRWTQIAIICFESHWMVDDTDNPSFDMSKCLTAVMRWSQPRVILSVWL